MAAPETSQNVPETESEDSGSPLFKHTVSEIKPRSLQLAEEHQAAQEVPSEPVPVRRPARKKRRGIGLSGIINALFLGLGSVGAYYGWKSNSLRMNIEFGAGLAWGIWTGLTYMKNYRRHRREKDILRCSLAQTNKRHLRELMKDAPYWVSYEEEEKVESLNKMIMQMWPFYERAICKQIIDTVEPLLDRFKPSFVSAITFKKLTFGDMPFKFTHMKVVRVTDDEVVLEAGVRWGGEAHVSIGVKLAGGGYLSPSVQRLNFFAMTRITLTRFVPQIPCFGAILVSLQKAPMVTFDINCGAGVGNVVEAWLKPFLTNNILGNLLVWPNRIVVPMFPESVIGPYDTLNLTTRGILKVKCISAHGLRKADLIGKGDPFVLLETVPMQPVKTRVIKNTDEPNWDEEKFLKVQEIEQILRVEVRDWEPAIVGAITQRTSELQGYCVIAVEDLVSGEMVDAEYDLGMAPWGSDGGAGSGYGKIHLQLTYLSLTDLRSERANIDSETSGAESSDLGVQRGLVFVLIDRAHNLTSGDGGGKTSAYCRLWLGGIDKETEPQKDTIDPVWNENLDWPNISSMDTLYVEVYDKGKISSKLLGRGKVDMSTLATEFSKDEVRRPIKANVGLEGGKGELILYMEWVPLDHHPVGRPRGISRATTDLFGDCERGVVMARLVHAKELKNVDIVGASDPYCLIKVGGNEKRTKTVKDDLNPVWNETFTWKGCNPRDTVSVICKDGDTFKDKVLGKFEIPLANALSPPEVVHTFECSLFTEDKKRKAEGQITIQLLYVSRPTDSKEPMPEEPHWPEVA